MFITDVSLLEELYNDIESRQANYDPDMLDCTDFDAYVLPTPIRAKLLNYSSLSLSRTGPILPLARRRLGRGGRVIYDRLIKTRFSSNSMTAYAGGYKHRGGDDVLLFKTGSLIPEVDTIKDDTMQLDSTPKSTSFDSSSYLPNSHLNAPGRSWYSLSHRAFLNRQRGVVPHTYVPGVSFGTSVDMTTYTPKRPRGRRTPKSMPSSVPTSNLNQGIPTNLIDSPMRMDPTASLGRQRPPQITQLSSSGTISSSPSYRTGNMSAPLSLVPSRPTMMTGERPSSFTYRPVFAKTSPHSSHAPMDSSTSLLPSVVGGGSSSNLHYPTQRTPSSLVTSTERPPNNEPT